MKIVKKVFHNCFLGVVWLMFLYILAAGLYLAATKASLLLVGRGDPISLLGVSGIVIYFPVLLAAIVFTGSAVKLRWREFLGEPYDG